MYHGRRRAHLDDFTICFGNACSRMVLLATDVARAQLLRVPAKKTPFPFGEDCPDANTPCSCTFDPATTWHDASPSIPFHRFARLVAERRSTRQKSCKTNQTEEGCDCEHASELKNDKWPGISEFGKAVSSVHASDVSTTDRTETEHCSKKTHSIFHRVAPHSVCIRLAVTCPIRADSVQSFGYAKACQFPRTHSSFPLRQNSWMIHDSSDALWPEQDFKWQH